MTTTDSARTTHLRLTRRGRIVMTTLAALPLVLGIGYVGLSGSVAAATSESSSAQFEYVTVQTGQSLWELAHEVAPDDDPRYVVDAIMSLNGLTSAVIYPGQSLAVPQL